MLSFHLRALRPKMKSEPTTVVFMAWGLGSRASSLGVSGLRV